MNKTIIRSEVKFKNFVSQNTTENHPNEKPELKNLNKNSVEDSKE
jgi:hypothetical protein